LEWRAVGNINKFNLTADSDGGSQTHRQTERATHTHTHREKEKAPHTHRKSNKQKPQVINFYDLFYGHAARATRPRIFGVTGGGGRWGVAT